MGPGDGPAKTDSERMEHWESVLVLQGCIGDRDGS